MSALAFLARPAAGYVGAGLSAILAIALAVVGVLLWIERGRADDLSDKLALSRASVAALEGEIAGQNAAIERLKAAADAAAANSKAAQAAAQAAARANLDKAEHILRERASGDLCAAASDLIERAIPGEAK